MASTSREPPPKRREPSLIGRLLSAITRVMFWLCVSLLVSIAIEWVGMTWFWRDEGINHVKAMLNHEQGHLYQQRLLYPVGYSQWIHDTVQYMNTWTTRAAEKTHQVWLHVNHYIYVDDVYQASKTYLEAIPYVAHVFFTRLGIILFSLPAFVLSGIYGAVDGLVERDLRRWGGGRESSNVYNIARKTVLPVFISACVVYLSLPISVHPAWVIMPFVIAFGFSVRVSFERLKKYF